MVQDVLKLFIWFKIVHNDYYKREKINSILNYFCNFSFVKVIVNNNERINKCKIL
jgi:hypothetical protein